MNDKISTQELELDARRKSVKRILGIGAVAGGGHAVGGWVTPVIKAVALPVHAQSSLSVNCSIEVNCLLSGIDFNVIVSGQVVPPTPGVTVNINIQYTSAADPRPSDFRSPATDGNGEYSSTVFVNPTGSVFITDITANVSLPDHPGAQSVCMLRNTDPGPHFEESLNYFCSHLPPP